ncbi:AMP-binding enzyme family protein [Methyloversatilis sp. RAC08]|uniref:AMP-binding enzyme n=1 Tax=Methyloversatilis sp. RAC08 TaxID=1842540 RepID=UPI00083DF664|nr:AMP-binding protein [Methyloversatilis sp. RAC08]AOF81971.1 AMP-binding enzyme family protein [Methyloversatilis sp. RAC08]
MTAPWYADEAAVARVLADLIAEEIRRLRPGGSAPPPPWPAHMALDETGFGLDSLERYTVAAAIAEMLQLHESSVIDALPGVQQFGQWCALAAEGLAQADTHLTFRTSGSTGTPKPCRHALNTLEAEADALADCIGPRRRVLLAVPVHHIYGFIFGVLLPPRLGATGTEDIRQLSPLALEGRLHAGDLIVSHPAHWALVDRFCPRLPADIVGITSTAPCPDALADALIAKGLARLIQIYGSSETAGVGWRDAAGAPYELMPHWRRTEGDAHNGDTVLTRATADGTPVQALLQDVLEWVPDGDRRFRLGGRRDEAVQVAGVNVFPARVRAVLLEHPQVEACAVRRMSAGEGERLKAFVVARAGTAPAALLPELEAWVKERLTAPECPRGWTFGDRLPRDERGKLADWSIAPQAR